MNINQRLQQMAQQGDESRGVGREDGSSGYGRYGPAAYEPTYGRSPDRSYGSGLGGGLWQGLLGRSLEMAEVQEEVAAEQQGRLAIIGPDQALNRLLLARLRQQPPVPGTEQICREGFFTLVQLPESPSPTLTDGTEQSQADGPDWRAAEYELHPQDLVETVMDHDVLIYLFPAQAGWQAQDAHWYARLRAAHVPLLPVAVLPTESDQEGWCGDEFSKSMRDRLGVRPAMMDLGDPTQWDGTDADDHVLALVQRMLALRPRLAVALAQEIPACRTLIAQRVIRTGALMTLLLGSEPIPLLDLPLHVATQWKVALQLAAIYGRPGLDYRSREMAGTIAVNLVVRHLAQQALKLVPLVGWLLSGLLSGISTWLMGQALVRHYRELQVIPLPNWHPQVWADQMRRGVQDHLPAVDLAAMPRPTVQTLRAQMARVRSGQPRGFGKWKKPTLQTVQIIPIHGTEGSTSSGNGAGGATRSQADEQGGDL